MITTTPTPAPWYAGNNSNDDQGLVIQEETGENIAVTYKAANARLIAAAPELLDILTETGKLICDPTVDAAMENYADTLADYESAGLGEAEYRRSIAAHVINYLQDKCLEKICAAVGKAEGKA